MGAPKHPSARCGGPAPAPRREEAEYEGRREPGRRPGVPGPPWSKREAQGRLPLSPGPSSPGSPPLSQLRACLHRDGSGEPISRRAWGRSTAAEAAAEGARCSGRREGHQHSSLSPVSMCWLAVAAPPLEGSCSRLTIRSGYSSVNDSAAAAETRTPTRTPKSLKGVQVVCF